MYIEPWLGVSSRKPKRVPQTPQNNRDRTDFHDNTIAVVDDDPAVCESTRLLLEIYGFSVITYKSGTEFLDQFPQVACIIVDYMMPNLNGLEFVAELRRQGVDTPAIMITATSDQTVERRAAELGMEQVLRKPLALQSLLSSIRKALE
jgi:two-component system, LuxR family, response regulator FixJ